MEANHKIRSTPIIINNLKDTMVVLVCVQQSYSMYVYIIVLKQFHARTIKPDRGSMPKNCTVYTQKFLELFMKSVFPPHSGAPVRTGDHWPL